MNITFELLLEASLTFAIWSYLYKENAAYRLAENIFIGIAVGHIVVMAIGSISNSAIGPLLNGEFIYVVPIILGFGLYFYFTKDYFYLYRIPLAVLVGTGMGIGVRGQVSGTIIKQLLANINILTPGTDITSALNGLIIALGSLLVIYYFVFTYSISRTGSAGLLSKIARYVLMITFGASFANVVMTRTSYLSGRLIFLWLTDAKYLIPVAGVIFAIGIIYNQYKIKQ